MRWFLLTLLSVAPVTVLGQSQQRGDVGPLDQAMLAYETGNLGEALALAEAAVKRDRKNAEAHHLLALVYDEEGPLRDARRARSHAERAVAVASENPRYLETRLRQLRRELSEERAFSMTDGRRAALARRILALDSTSAVAHEERALGYLLEFDWRRGLAEQQGGWDRTAERGMSGAANRALRRAQQHLDHAFTAEPERSSAHRLALRTAATTRDDVALLAAARRMKRSRSTDPDADLFLGLALYRAGQAGGADRAFAAALAGFPEAQRLAFESVALFVSRDEEARFAADSAAFAARFWDRRDPRLLSAENERRIGHFARLALADLLFTDPRSGRRGWNSTKGEVAVRYGLPRAEVTWLANDVVGKDFSRYNRWAYDDFTLLFEDAFRDGDYEFWSSAAGEDEVTRARSLMTRLPERFDYAPPNRVAFPFATTTFQGTGGETEVVVSYRVPAEAVTGAFLLDGEGRVIGEQRSTASPNEASAVTVSAEPGTYELAVEFESSGAVGFERVSLAVPEYGGFTLSGLLPAVLVEEGESAGGLERRGFEITPTAGAAFAVGQPVYLYFEGYDLAPAQDSGSRYAVEITLRPQDTASGLARFARRLFGERERGVAVEFEGYSPAQSFGEYVVLDTGGQAPGPYALTLRLRDLVSGETRSRTADVFLR